MTKKQLKAYIDLKKERDDIKRRIKELELEMYGPRSQRMDGMPRSGPGENYIQEERMDTKNALLEIYKEKGVELDEKLLAIERAIEKLEPTQRLILRLHYIDGLTWEQVTVAVNYSWTQTHRYHSAALEKLKEEEVAK